MLSTDAPYNISAHANGVNIIIELIRRYCSEIEQLEYQYHQHEISRQTPRDALILEPSPEKVHAIGTDLNHLINVLGDNIAALASLLTRPRSVVSNE